MNIVERKLKEFRENVVNALGSMNSQISSLRAAVQDQSKATRESAKNNDKQRQVTPKVISEVQFPRTMETRKCEDDAESENKHQRWILLLTGLTLLAVTWYACEAHKQSKSVGESAEAAKGANIVTQAANRAYIGFIGINATHVTYRTKTGDESHMWFSANMLNGGNTPANATNYFRVDPLPQEPDEPEFVGNLSAVHPSNVAQPHSTVTLGIERKTTTTLLGRDIFVVPVSQMRTTNDVPNIFAWGWLSYRDAFPGSEPHVTEFCSRIESIGLRSTGELEINWTLCSTHNCVDKSCQDYDSLAKFAPKL